MNHWTELAAYWLADVYLLSTLLLTTILLLLWKMGQPARRLAVVRATLAGLTLLAFLSVAPGWSLLHLLTTPAVTPTPSLAGEVSLPRLEAPVQAVSDAAIPQAPPVHADADTASFVVEQPIERRVHWPTLVVATYLVGAAIVLGWMLLGALQASRLCRQAQPAPVELQKLLATIVDGQGVVPRLLISDHVHSAVALGAWYHVVLLPTKWISDKRQLHSVLAHEAAHIGNGDLRLLAANRALAILFWAQPLYWLLKRQIRLDQETLADATAANVSGRHDYAEQLVAWAREATEARTPRLASSVGLWEGPSQMRRRVAVLLDEKLTVLRTCSRRWRVGSAISLLTVAVCLSLVTLTPRDTLLAEVKSEKGTEAEETQDARAGVVKVYAASPPADSDEEEVKATSQFTLTPATPAADSDSSDRSAAETETAADTTALSDKEKLKLMQPLYKRLHNTTKPNMIQGICVDENGQPLADVTVEVSSRRIRGAKQDAKPILTTKTNKQGEFRFVDIVNIEQEFPEGIPEEHFLPRNAKILTMVGRTDGRVPGHESNRASSIARSGKSCVWVMQPAEALRGRVTDQQGRPVAGARVTAGLIAWLGGAQRINTATTNTEGQYVISDLAPFDAAVARRKLAEHLKAHPESAATRVSGGDPRKSLVVKHPKFAIKRATITRIPGTVDVQLVPGSSIEGKVTLPADSAAEKFPVGSVVRLQRVLPQPKPGERPDAYSYQIEKTTIDETGHYRIESLPAGKYHLTADVADWVTQGIENVEVAQGETITAPDILLTRGGRVRVQLVDDKTRKPIRFEKPTKGYIMPQRRPVRASAIHFRNNIAEFSTDGIGEIQPPAGKYAFIVSIPSDGGEHGLISAKKGDYKKWPIFEVVEGEQLNISERMQSNTGKTKVVITTSSPSDESSEDETSEDTVVPETSPAEESEAGDKLTSDPPKSPRTDRMLVDDRFIFCPIKTALQRQLLGTSRGDAEEASLCVFVNAAAMKKESGVIDNKALDYPNITKKLRQYSKQNDHLVVFRILGTSSPDDSFEDISDRMEVLS